VPKPVDMPATATTYFFALKEIKQQLIIKRKKIRAFMFS